MAVDIHFDASASREYLRTRRWYAARAGESIASAFVEELDRVLICLADSPTSGTEFRQKYRWLRLRRFPYLVYYRIVSDQKVVVLAVTHAAVRAIGSDAIRAKFVVGSKSEYLGWATFLPAARGLGPRWKHLARSRGCLASGSTTSLER